MKFTKDDWKIFFLGVASSLAGVLLWDIVKHKKKLLEFQDKK